MRCLRGIQQASPSEDAVEIDWLYDAPAALVDDIRRGNLNQANLPVATVTMVPEPKDLAELWQLLTSKRILRTGDHISGVKRAEIEDLLRATLAIVARDELGCDSVETVATQASRPVMEILGAEHEGVSKWKLARAFVRWLAANGTAALTEDERRAWDSLVTSANKALL